MQISTRTVEATERYRTAKAAYIDRDLDSATADEVDAAHRAYVEATVRLANEVLLDVDAARERR